jgi:alpha-glucosidase
MSLVIASVFIGLAAGSSSAAPSTWRVTSPDGALVFELRLGPDATGSDVGALTYRVEHRAGMTRHEVVQWSPLGVARHDQPFVSGLRVATIAKATPVDDSYVALHGKRQNIRHRANEQVFTFANGAGARLDVVVRAANDGVAFRYRFPEHDSTSRTVVEESTGFAVPAGATAWMLPQQPAGKYTPAYEDLFVEVPAGTAAPTPAGWDFPALFKIHDGGLWLLIAESGVGASNCGTRLASAVAGTRYQIRLPDVGEGKGVGKVEPTSTLPWTLPWRVLMIGTTPAAIVESTLVEDLAPASAMTDTSWVKPGRASWSWWSDDDSPKNEEALTRFVDFGAQMGWEYSLIDANWNLMDPAALQRVLAHAREKGVGILLWYNSGGPHNDVTEQPRDRMDQRDVRRREFATLREWGVKGVKVDFWQSDKQDRIQQYLDLLKDAADFHLMADFHGCTMPRGWSRTWPHLMSMEAVPGAEQYKFNEKYPARAAWHNTVLVFTRNVVGSMDYTPVTFSDSKFPHLTTSGHELALSVVFESGLQHFADSVAAYRALPEAAQQFLKAVPAAWQETRLVAGEPGSLAVVARRGADGWFIGGISGKDTPQHVSLDLSFLGGGMHSLTVIADGAGPRQLASSSSSVGAGGKFEIDLLPRGGFVARVAGQ